MRDDVLTKARKASEGLCEPTMPLPWGRIKSKCPPSGGPEPSLPAAWTAGGSHGALEAPFCLGPLSGTKLWDWDSCQFSAFHSFGPKFFHNLEVSLIDHGPEFHLLAYFRHDVSSPFLYFAFCVFFLLVGFELPLVEF